MKKPWTARELAELRRRYEAGETDAAIAVALGRSVGSVSNCRQAHKIERPRETLLGGAPRTASELALACEMYARGEPNEIIAATLGRSRIAIKRLITDRGLARDLTQLPQPSIFDTEQEQWRAVAHAPEYAVSNRGRVMSLHFGRRGRILSQWADEDGYRHVQLQIGARSKRHSVHRLVAAAFLGPPPSPKHDAAHGDGNPGNNEDWNLRWATKADNQADRLIHGTAERELSGRFKRSRRARLTW